MPAEPKHHRLEARDGVHLAVREWRRADAAAPVMPTVLLHGWMDNADMLAALAHALGHRWTLAVDWRGFGESGSAPGGQYFYPQYLADLECVLNYFAKDRQALLVGHSLGGNVAGLYAGIRPQRVSAIVSLEGFGLGEQPADAAPRRYAAWLDSLQDTPRLRDFPDHEAVAAHLMAREGGAAPAAARAAALQWTTADGARRRVRGDPAHKRPNPVVYRLAEAMACWRCITAPVLWLYGDASQRARALMKQPDWQQRIACHRHLTVRAIAGAGHDLHWQLPHATAREINEWLEAARGDNCHVSK